jgi:hypothetical protein
MENMAKKKKYKKPFSAAVDHYMRFQGWTNKDMGLAVGYANGKMLSAIRLEKTDGAEDKRRKIAEKLGFTLDILIQEGRRLIQGQTQQQSMPTDNNIVNIDHQHWKVVEQFLQKDTALQINQALVELEKIDPSSLEGMLEMVLDRLSRKKREAAKKRDAGNDKT